MILNVNGDHDAKTLEQLRDVDSRAVYSALMADGHLGYVMPIGGVAAYSNKVSPVGVGFDIACGNAAVKLDLTLEQLLERWSLDQLADQLWRDFEFGIGRANQHRSAPADHPLLEDDRWSIVPRSEQQKLIGKARSQLGTCGSGNHYLDIFTDEDLNIWVGVHFGSRGFGHTVASSFLALSQGGEWGDRGKEEEILLDLDSQLGQDYWNMMQLAGDYAYAGRDWVVDTVASEILEAPILDRVHNNHNFAWREEHYGEELIVVRKGATPAFPGQRGFVGGSMGDDSVILHGVATRGSGAANLYSTVHGAGRVMGRMEARGKRAKDGSWKREPRVDRQEMEEWLNSMGVHRRGGDLDEAPQAYRRLNEVLDAQGATVEVEYTLSPLVVCMAGKGN